MQRILLLSATIIFVMGLFALTPAKNLVSNLKLEDQNNLNSNISEIVVETQSNYSKENPTLEPVQVFDNPGPGTEINFNETLEKGKCRLFIFPEEKERSWIMKGAPEPLDIVYISEKRKIVNIHLAYPQPEVENIYDYQAYSSEEPAKYVIETPANYTAQKIIQEGDTVKFGN